MSLKFANIIEVLLKKNDISPILQEKVYQFAISNNRPDLLVLLLRTNNLTNQIDDLIGEIKLASIKIAWLTKGNRTIDQIRKALKNEKRITVLREVINNPKTSIKVYNTLFEIIIKEFNSKKRKNPTKYNQYLDLLNQIINNQLINKKARIRAANLLISQELNNYSKDKDDNCNYDPSLSNRISSIFESVPEVVTNYQNHDNINIIFAVAEYSSITLEEQKKVLAPIYDKINIILTDKEADKNKVYYREESVDELIRLINFLCENSTLSSEISSDILDILKKLKKRYQNSYFIDRIDDIIKLVENRISSGLSLKDQVSNINSISEMNSVIEQFTELHDKNILSFRSNNMKNLAISLIVSEYCTPEMSRKVYPLYHTYYSAYDPNILDINTVINPKDIKKLAYSIIARSSYDEYFDELLDKTPNKIEVFKAILKIVFEDKIEFDRSIILKSKYMKSEYLNYLSLDDFYLLSIQEEKKEFSEQLENILNKIAQDKETWENYITLADEFEGTFAELELLSSRL